MVDLMAFRKILKIESLDGYMDFREAQLNDN